MTRPITGEAGVTSVVSSATRSEATIRLRVRRLSPGAAWESGPLADVAQDGMRFIVRCRRASRGRRDRRDFECARRAMAFPSGREGSGRMPWQQKQPGTRALADIKTLGEWSRQSQTRNRGNAERGGGAVEPIVGWRDSRSRGIGARAARASIGLRAMADADRRGKEREGWLRDRGAGRALTRKPRTGWRGPSRSRSRADHQSAGAAQPAMFRRLGPHTSRQDRRPGAGPPRRSGFARSRRSRRDETAMRSEDVARDGDAKVAQQNACRRPVAYDGPVIGGVPGLDQSSGHGRRAQGTSTVPR